MTKPKQFIKVPMVGSHGVPDPETLDEATEKLFGHRENEEEGELLFDESAEPDEAPADDGEGLGTFSKERIGLSRPAVIGLIAAVLVVLLGVGALMLFLPKSEGAPVFGEVMTSNERAYVHPAHGSVDWIELYNPTEHAFDLGGCGLTDDLKKQYKYRFPEGTVIEAHGYLVLYCTGGTAASDSDPYCTGFGLKQEGETLYLIDRSYRELAMLTVPALETDTAYARTGNGFYKRTTTVTPGAENVFTD